MKTVIRMSLVVGSVALLSACAKKHDDGMVVMAPAPMMTKDGMIIQAEPMVTMQGDDMMMDADRDDMGAMTDSEGIGTNDSTGQANR